MQSPSEHSTSERIALWFAAFAMEKPWRVIGLSLVIVALAASGLPGLGLAQVGGV